MDIQSKCFVLELRGQDYLIKYSAIHIDVQSKRFILELRGQDYLIN